MDFDDPQYDANFEFDAPRYYDFEFMNEGTPGDRWFDTAPDGPGCKADKSKQQHVCVRQTSVVASTLTALSLWLQAPVLYCESR